MHFIQDGLLRIFLGASLLLGAAGSSILPSGALAQSVHNSTTGKFIQSGPNNALFYQQTSVSLTFSEPVSGIRRENIKVRNGRLVDFVVRREKGNSSVKEVKFKIVPLFPRQASLVVVSVSLQVQGIKGVTSGKSVTAPAPLLLTFSKKRITPPRVTPTFFSPTPSTPRTPSPTLAPTVTPLPSPSAVPTIAPTIIPIPSTTPLPSVTVTPTPQQTRESIVYGITIDNISGISQIREAVAKFPKKMTVRVVFDEFVAATYYKSAVQQLQQNSFVMGELLDSFYMKDYSLSQYKDRALEYLNAFNVDIWEIGNEINGEWLGAGAIDKAGAAFDLVEARGGKTALTLYYNEGCWEKPENEMFRWVNEQVPQRMKTGLDYVFVSYYEDDCEGQVLSSEKWKEVFLKLHTLFPNSKLGIGEMGTVKADKKEEYVRRYYSMILPVPGYVGGNFYWYGRQDLIPATKPLWNFLANLLAELP